ncbi:MAG: ABC transporter permease [Prevotella sp.]
MLSYFLARKIYRDEKGGGRVSLPAIRIAIMGMALGIAVIIVSLSVVLGFKHTIRDKVIGFGSHIVVRNFLYDQDEALKPVSTSDSLVRSLHRAPNVTHIQRYAMKQGLLKTDSDFLGVMMKGVGEDWDSTFISQNLHEGTVPAFSSERASNEILISKLMSDKLGVHAGDKLFAYFIGDGTVRTRRFLISGVYNTNLTKFDETLVFCDLYSVQRLNGWQPDQASGLELTVGDFDNIETTASWLVKHLNRKEDRYGQPYTSATVLETNPQIFSWLGLLDVNVWIILVLMVCVATVTMTSGLLIIILERIPMIGVMKAVGARDALLRKTFLWFGMFIIARGMLVGNIFGLAVCLLQRHLGLVSLDPQTYYVSTAPVEINVPLIVLVNILVFLMCSLILCLPAMLVSHIHPSKSIKFKE